jgi:hypothetical protein
MEFSQNWEIALKKKYYLEIDAGRRLARCLQTYAETAFCLGNIGVALAKMAEGLRSNQNGANTLGGLPSFTQGRLMLLKNEVQAFTTGRIDSVDVNAALTRLEALGAEMTDHAEKEGWYVIDIISIAESVARAAATALRVSRNFLLVNTQAIDLS